MDLSFTYDTYQDVRRNLFRYSIPFLVLAGFCAFFWVLPPAHYNAVLGLLQAVSARSPWKELLGTGFGIAVFIAAAFLLTEILQVHDQLYDKYVIRWREYYATDYILPRLVQPWAGRMTYRFFEAAEEHTRVFQRQLFYPFVGDRDLKIPKNKLIRFYEVVTVYWLTQINEIVLITLTLLILIYRFWGPTDLAYRTMLINDLVVIGAAFLINRVWARSSIQKVRRATEDEIRSIHEDVSLRYDLEQRLVRLCRDYAIPYEQNSQR